MRKANLVAVICALVTTCLAATFVIYFFAAFGGAKFEFSAKAIMFAFAVGFVAATGFWLVPVALSSRPRISAGARVLVVIFQVPLLMIFGGIIFRAHEFASNLFVLAAGIAGSAASIYTLFVVLRAEGDAHTR